MSNPNLIRSSKTVRKKTPEGDILETSVVTRRIPSSASGIAPPSRIPPPTSRIPPPSSRIPSARFSELPSTSRLRPPSSTLTASALGTPSQTERKKLHFV